MKMLTSNIRKVKLQLTETWGKRYAIMIFAVVHICKLVRCSLVRQELLHRCRWCFAHADNTNFDRLTNNGLVLPLAFSWSKKWSLIWSSIDECYDSQVLHLFLFLFILQACLLNVVSTFICKIQWMCMLQLSVASWIATEVTTAMQTTHDALLTQWHENWV